MNETADTGFGRAFDVPVDLALDLSPGAAPHMMDGVMQGVALPCDPQRQTVLDLDIADLAELDGTAARAVMGSALVEADHDLPLRRAQCDATAARMQATSSGPIGSVRTDWKSASPAARARAAAELRSFLKGPGQSTCTASPVKRGCKRHRG